MKAGDQVEVKQKCLVLREGKPSRLVSGPALGTKGKVLSSKNNSCVVELETQKILTIPTAALRRIPA